MYFHPDTLEIHIREHMNQLRCQAQAEQALRRSNETSKASFILPPNPNNVRSKFPSSKAKAT
jgi:hypothetical protein